MSQHDVYVPRSLKELVRMRDRRIREIHEIVNQLCAPCQTGPDGKVMSREEYGDWIARASKALDTKMRQARVYARKIDQALCDWDAGYGPSERVDGDIKELLVLIDNLTSGDLDDLSADFYEAAIDTLNRIRRDYAPELNEFTPLDEYDDSDPEPDGDSQSEDTGNLPNDPEAEE